MFRVEREKMGGWGACDEKTFESHEEADAHLTLLLQEHGFEQAQHLRVVEFQPDSLPDVSARVLKSLMASLAANAPTGDYSSPLWAVLADLGCVGSTSACRLLRELGLDPEQRVLPPMWPDLSRQTVVAICEQCEGMVEGEGVDTCECWGDEEED